MGWHMGRPRRASAGKAVRSISLARRLIGLALAACTVPALTQPVPQPVSQPVTQPVTQSVTLAGTLGFKALVIVDGGPPISLAAGESYKGVKLLLTAGDTATFEIAGKKVSMRVGDSPASVGASGARTPSSDKIVMTAGSGGHFLTSGLINGRPVQLMVDTGATSVSLGAADADRIGLKYQTGQPIRLATANGTTSGWRVKLDSMRVGDVDVYNVDAVVSPGAMPFVLLGNSFLNRFQMTRANDQMVLLKRY